jgi:hypothetical protein
MHTTGYKVQRIAGPMSETVLEAAIYVSPTPAAAQGRLVTLTAKDRSPYKKTALIAQRGFSIRLARDAVLRSYCA